MISVKFVQVSAIALLASFSWPSQSAAAAEGVAKCWVKNDLNLLTHFFKAEYASVLEVTGQWRDYLRANHAPNLREYVGDCTIFPTEAQHTVGKHFVGFQMISWTPTKSHVASQGPAETRKANITEPKKGLATSAPVPVAAAAPKKVEVPGPDGAIRLSPEAVARNKAAEEESQRAAKERAEMIAHAKREAAKHAESVAKAAAQKLEYERQVRDYERQLATNAAQVAAHKAQMETYNKNAAVAGGTERTFQATGAIRATKDEAMASLMGQNLPPITNVQCKEVTSYKPARWTCWGTYRQTVTQSSTSKQ